MTKYTPEKEKTIEFLENSKLISQALVKYQDYEQGLIDLEDLDTWLKDKANFGLHDENSFNCHSFLLMVMKYELNINQIETFDDIHMDRDRWIDAQGDLYQEGYFEHVTEEFPDEDDERMKALNKLENNVMDNSKKFIIEKDKLAGNIKEIIELIQQGQISRFSFIINSDENGAHNDEHSFVLLGLNTNKDDVVVLEKIAPGDTIQTTTLSEILKYWSKWSFGDLVLHIPTKNIRDLYPKK